MPSLLQWEEAQDTDLRAKVIKEAHLEDLQNRHYNNKDRAH